MTSLYELASMSAADNNNSVDIDREMVDDVTVDGSQTPLPQAVFPLPPAIVPGPLAPQSSYCLELRTVQSVAFKVLVEALKELLTDTCIEFDENGVKVVAMDTSHIVLVHLVLQADRFEFYRCSNKMSIGVNMLNLHKLIKTITNNDILTLFIDGNDMNHLGIKIENGDKNSKTSYKLTLLDLDNPNISIPPAQFNSVITLPSTDFQKICRDMHNLAEYIEIKDVQNQLIFSCKGDFCSQETILCDGDNNASNSSMGAVGSSGGGGGGGSSSSSSNIAQRRTTLHASDIVQGVFSLKHLVLFTKCTNLCSTVELFLKNDYPLIIRYSVASLGDIKLCLAPQTNAPPPGGV